MGDLPAVALRFAWPRRMRTADALDEPILATRATGTFVVKEDQQRRG